MTALADQERDTRTCSKCRETKPESDFSGRNNYCTPCRKAYRVAYRAANPEKFRAYGAKYRKDPDVRRRKFLWKHALTPERFEELFEAQGRACAICRTDEPNGQGWHVDHDHTCCPAGHRRRCGKCFRGILCHNCNVGLGHFGDDAERLLTAVRYLGIKIEFQRAFL